jgi:hypothetical protein
MNLKKIPKEIAQKKKEFALQLMEGMEKLGTPISRRVANRLVARKLGLLREEEKGVIDRKFYGQSKHVSSSYFK